MSIDTKLFILEEIHKIHEGFAKTLSVACERYCATCCTKNVTMTTLEGYHIIRYLALNRKSQVLLTLARGDDPNRLRPNITTNHLAALLARGEEAPEAKDSVFDGRCPFLADDLCTIYPVRPFGCRCFLSTQNCRDTGFADIDPFVVTANTLFLQFIEHVDVDGLFGNLIDIIIFLEITENRKAYLNNAHLPPGDFLLSNRSILVLLIPPEHRDRMGGILSRLRNIKVPTD